MNEPWVRLVADIEDADRVMAVRPVSPALRFEEGFAVEADEDESSRVRYGCAGNSQSQERSGSERVGVGSSHQPNIGQTRPEHWTLADPGRIEPFMD
ncbi:hypothetical protein [Methylobacterium sp. Leaf117]|uniref:hypothetical protein n=1 Tax=Methylobacterium sp. Leaf117 TaxID=1736260 RepID=UPI001FCCDCD8|nr:hypothetical protein [Methylobacterium sp. Leaf117]